MGPLARTAACGMLMISAVACGDVSDEVGQSSVNSAGEVQSDRSADPDAEDPGDLTCGSSGAGDVNPEDFRGTEQLSSSSEEAAWRYLEDKRDFYEHDPEGIAQVEAGRRWITRVEGGTPLTAEELQAGAAAELQAAATLRGAHALSEALERGTVVNEERDDGYLDLTTPNESATFAYLTLAFVPGDGGGYMGVEFGYELPALECDRAPED